VTVEFPSIFNLIMSLPPFPSSDSGWPANLYAASRLIGDIYRNAKAMIHAENFDVHRVRYHSEAVERDATPVLLMLENLAEEDEQDDRLSSWINSVILRYEELRGELKAAEQTALGQ
jgi:hypothetical protein